ncbi:hypothetical protein [Nocardioides stalactiti]|uniref:hypothetical protein n=1 Tax=Nocardioides stalactiti TaxID=2755356 RepID=UPI0016016F9F|nr:hypothetical protein [Nocardioides stalactiti]
MAWIPLLASLAVNYLQHRRGRATICSVTRRVLPRAAFAALWAAVTTYLAVHVWRGYRAYD